MSLKSFLSRHVYVRSVCIAVGVIAICGALYLFGVFSTFQARLTDSLYDSYPVAQKIVIVKIDDRSIQQVGRWPWDREVFARAIDDIASHNPKIIGIDVNFPEPTSHDQVFASAIKKAGTVVLPIEATFGTTRVNGVLSADTLLSPVPDIYGSSFAQGVSNVIVARDGVVRSLPVTTLYNSKEIPSFFLAISQQVEGVTPTIPRDRSGNMIVNFAAPPTRFTNISFVDLINKQYNGDIFKDAIVLMGSTAPDLHDAYVTPISRGALTPGVEIHAHAINTVLSNRFLLNQDVFWVLITLSILTISFALLFTWLKVLKGLLVLVVSVVAVLGVSLFAFSYGMLVPFLYLVLSLFLVYGMIILQRFMVEEKEKRRLRKALGSYVSPAVADEIMKQIDTLGLGGTRTKITVLFSDIRGFTSLSEKLSPEGLVHILNQYLTRMTGEIFDHRGVVDKYIGDAIMAFWGAPLSDNEQAFAGLSAAYAMKKALAEMNIKWKEEGVPELAIGIGLNTDEAIVGNIGSDQRFDYTAIGDGVNLASRLEGLNKEYGTNIIFSEFTLKDLKDTGKEGELIYRFLDRVKVKGKQQPVEIYELMCLASEKEQYVSLLTAYTDALEVFNKKQFAEARVLFEKIASAYNDAPSRLYVHRITEIIDNNLQDSWTGVHEMKTK